MKGKTCTVFSGGSQVREEKVHDYATGCELARPFVLWVEEQGENGREERRFDITELVESEVCCA